MTPRQKLRLARRFIRGFGYKMLAIPAVMRYNGDVYGFDASHFQEVFVMEQE